MFLLATPTDPTLLYSTVSACNSRVRSIAQHSCIDVTSSIHKL